MPIMKKIQNVIFVKVEDERLTIFKSLLEKELFVKTHKDATIGGNHAREPLYMLIDTENDGWCITPKRAVTYNEAIEILKHYF